MNLVFDLFWGLAGRCIKDFLYVSCVSVGCLLCILRHIMYVLLDKLNTFYHKYGKIQLDLWKSNKDGYILLSKQCYSAPVHKLRSYNTQWVGGYQEFINRCRTMKDCNKIYYLILRNIISPNCVIYPDKGHKYQ